MNFGIIFLIIWASLGFLGYIIFSVKFLFKHFKKANFEEKLLFMLFELILSGGSLLLGPILLLDAIDNLDELFVGWH